MIVSKFGGTSVQDAEAIRRLVCIIEDRLGDRPVVVVSALAKVTDALQTLVRTSEAGDVADLRAAIAALRDRHRGVAEALGVPGAAEPIAEDLDALELALIARANRAATPAELDLVMGRGELWSSRLVAAAFGQAGIRAAWVDAREVIVTDDRFTRATPIPERIAARAAERIAPLVAEGVVPVTQGYIGATEGGVMTTLGRGGSDFTASLLGAALRAERVEIWTDVDGLMTADPRIVPAAQTLAVASYDEAAELATFGAKVLHPATQQPLAAARIPIIILNSRAPERHGTTIVATDDLERFGDSPIRSISWKKGITVINIEVPRMLGAYGFLRRIFEVFERHEVVVDVLASSEVSVSLTIEDPSRLEAVVADLSQLGEVRTEGGRAIVAVVGIGIRTSPGLAGRVFSTVAPANIDLISQGASAINMTFVVREADGPDVVRRLHHEFFGALSMRLVMVGDGKMGRAIAALAREQGHEVVAVIGEAENATGAALTRERLAGAEVAIEFTTPHAVVGNLRALLEAGIPTVVGTTGWDDAFPEIRGLVAARQGTLLYASNFSIGVQLFLRTARDLARRFAGRPEFDGYIVEEHHRQKLDAPSGTARSLQEAALAGDPARAFPITSVRAGSIPGTHLLAYDGPFERVELSHVARDRRIFAAGALAAAQWLIGRQGLFTFEQMLFGTEDA